MEYFPPNIDGTPIRPQIIGTSGYLNDPIKAEADARFTPHSLLANISASESGGVSQYKRDQGNFIQVDLNSKEQRSYSIEMMSPLYKREVINKIIDRTFTQFLPDLTNG